MTWRAAGGLACAAAFGAALFVPATAAIIVDLAGGGDYTTIQAGIEAAAEGDTVLVMPGTYTGAGNRDLFGSGYTNNIVLRGSAGAAATIIDCQNTGGTRGINFIGGQDTTCVVDGFTIRRGRLTQSGYPGAGIRCENASPKLLNLIIEDNTNVAGYGGGLHCNNNSSPILRNVVFEGNHAQAGGGLLCNTNSSPRLRDVTFLENDAVTHGGGAYCQTDCDALFSNVVFEGNVSDGKGGGLACYRASPALANVVFLENAAEDSGGAFFIQRWSYPVIVNTTMSGNSAPAGGAVCIREACDPTFMNSIIAFTGPGASTVHCGSLAAPTFTHCVVFANAPGDSLCGDHYDNAFVDPLFCNVLTGDLTLAANSPCLPGSPSSPWGEEVGALGRGCVNSTVEPTTWGRIKWLYR